MFGTDQGPDQPMYRAWWRLYESADEFIEGSNWWRHCALDLPDSVLKPFYRDNAARVVNWERTA